MRHIIPNNIKDDGQVFGGMLKKRNSIEAGIIIVIGIGAVKILGSFNISIMIIAAIGVIFFFLPAVFALIGIGDQSLTEALGTHLNYRKMPEILEYRLPEGSIDDDEDKPQNMEEKLKQYKERKSKEKEDKKNKKARQKEEKKRRKKNRRCKR